MSEICQPRMTTACEEIELQRANQVGECPSWTACLPFGGQLVSKGGCINYTPGTPPPDGVYSKIVIANGCIISAELADIPLYTSSPCAPVPVPCDCGGEEGGLPEPSPTMGNLFKYDASNRPLVKVSVRAGEGISITGVGTTEDPLVITNVQQQQGQQYFRSGNAAISLSGTGTSEDPYTYTHVLNLSGKHGPYVFDSYGHLTGYEPSSTAGGVTNILEGDGIKVEMDVATGIATISLADPTTVITGTYTLGGYDIEFYRNRITRISPVIVSTSGTYNFRASDGGLIAAVYNDYGSLQDIQYTPPVVDNSIVTTSVTKRFATSGDTSREIMFTIEKPSAFRISYMDNLLPNDAIVYVNSVVIDGSRFPSTASHHLEAITPALYDASTHVVSIYSEAGFTSAGVLTVTLTTVA